MLEREVKLLFPDADAARAAIRRTGAAPLRARRLQDDALFDTADEMLRRRGCALRVRREPAQSFLTFKGPVQPGAVKIREEHETVVGDADALVRVLGGLGFRVWFRYQKYREEFSIPGAVVAIDETPVGTFVEIEGAEEAIGPVVEALGRTADDFILDSYYRLFMKRRAEAGLSGDHMVFAAE
jgi:adenylate cyclase class 2